MLELARHETRSAARSHPEQFNWGIVDAILGVLMLPFGVWMFVIEALVTFVANPFDHDHASSATPPAG